MNTLERSFCVFYIDFNMVEMVRRMYKKELGGNGVKAKRKKNDEESQLIRASVDIFTDSILFSEDRMQRYLRKRENILQCNRMHSRCSYSLEMELPECKDIDSFLRKMKRYVPGIVSWHIGIVGSSVL